MSETIGVFFSLCGVALFASSVWGIATFRSWQGTPSGTTAAFVLYCVFLVFAILVMYFGWGIFTQRVK